MNINVFFLKILLLKMKMKNKKKLIRRMKKNSNIEYKIKKKRKYKFGNISDIDIKKFIDKLIKFFNDDESLELFELEKIKEKYEKLKKMQGYKELKYKMILYEVEKLGYDVERKFKDVSFELKKKKIFKSKKKEFEKEKKKWLKFAKVYLEVKLINNKTILQELKNKYKKIFILLLQGNVSKELYENFDEKQTLENIKINWEFIIKFQRNKIKENWKKLKYPSLDNSKKSRVYGKDFDLHCELIFACTSEDLMEISEKTIYGWFIEFYEKKYKEYLESLKKEKDQL